MSEPEIIEIAEYTDVNSTMRRDDYYGIQIITNKQVIRCFISSENSCCEQFDVYLLDNDNISDAIFDDSHFKIRRRPKCGLEPDILMGKELMYVKVGTDDEYDYTNSVSVLIGIKQPIDVVLPLPDDIINVIYEYTFKEYNIFIFNEHNGCYPHTYKRSWENYENDGTL